MPKVCYVIMKTKNGFPYAVFGCNKSTELIYVTPKNVCFYYIKNRIFGIRVSPKKKQLGSQIAASNHHIS